MGDGREPVDDDELVFRRVPEQSQRYNPTTRILSPEAFAPHKTADQTGISLSRQKYKSVEEASRGRPGKQNYVATLRAGDLKANAIRILPDPLPDDPGHCVLPDINSGNRKDDATLLLQRELVRLTLSVDGPFGEAALDAK